MTFEYITLVANHLWQSTVFAGLVYLATLALKSNYARVRHWLWLTVSLKFLIPFSLLVSLGGHFFRPAAPSPSQQNVSLALEEFSQPFVTVQPDFSNPAAARPLLPAKFLPALILTLWICGCVAVLLSRLRPWRRIRAAVRGGRPIMSGRELEILRGLQQLMRTGKGIELISCSVDMEPGVFGVFRQVLLLPTGIADRLDDAQLEAILAHEMCHVRRRDNLTAVLHMLVEVLFWFHPLVWWLGARLVQERERACDEEALQAGIDREVYAEGILKVCRFYVGSPLACVAGVTGSNLKKRIESIMIEKKVVALGVVEKAFLAAGGVAAIAAPILFGVMNATSVRGQSPAASSVAPSFEVASIKENKSGNSFLGILGCHGTDGGATAPPLGRCSSRNVTLRQIIATAYDISFFQTDYLISGGPDWLDSAVFDIDAKSEPPTTQAQLHRMLQSLLAERFKLKLHHEDKELPVFALVVARSGAKLQAAPRDRDCSVSNAPNMPCHSFSGGQGRGLTGQSVNMRDLSVNLTYWAHRIVVDRTGIDGVFDIKTTPWIPEQAGPNFAAEAGVDPNVLPTLFSMLQEQLGLRLESQKASVETFVIDSAEKPSEDGEAAPSQKQAGRNDESAGPTSFQVATSPNVATVSRSSSDRPLLTRASLQVIPAMPAMSPPAFEVASIKPMQMAAGMPTGGGCRGIDTPAAFAGGPFTMGMGRCLFNAVTLKTLISMAYSLNLFYTASGRTPEGTNRIFGGPDWAESDRFRIEAKSQDPPATHAQLLQMLQTLLADQFKLKFHRETKEAPGFALLIGKNGSKLQEAAADETQKAGNLGKGLLNGPQVMPEFAELLALSLGVPVADRTGLTGRYHVELEWSPSRAAEATSADSTGPSLFTALQEQLGLRLESQKLPIEMFVIDSAEKPDEFR